MTYFLNIFVPKFLFCPLRDTVIIREGTKLAKGHLYVLMWHLALHIRALIATTDPGNCPRESLFCPWWGTVVKAREDTKWAKGHLHALMGHLALHISAFIETVEPGNLSQWIIIFVNHYFYGEYTKWANSWIKEGAHSYLNRALTLKVVPLVVPTFLIVKSS